MFGEDLPKELRDPPLWHTDITRSKQSNTQYHASFSYFAKGLFLNWRRSVWQVVFPELAVWLLLYGVISAIYRYLPDEKQADFQAWCLYCKNFTSLIPLAFILGFYVSQVYTRWWGQWSAIPWIGKLAIVVRDLDNRDDDDGLFVRWTFMRYLLLGMGITLQRISTSFRLLYPDLKSFMDIGIANEEEVQILEKCEAKTEMCYEWAGEMIRRHEVLPHCTGISHMRVLRQLVIDWRTGNAVLRGFNNHPVPLAMVNVMAFAVYTYFLAALFGRQFFLRPHGLPSTTPTHEETGIPYDYYVPWFTLIEFIFYVGWFKLAGMLYDPFSAHGCEHNLQRVWDEEIVWARQGCHFVNEGFMPQADRAMMPQRTTKFIPYGLVVPSEVDGVGGEEQGNYHGADEIEVDEDLRRKPSQFRRRGSHMVVVDSRPTSISDSSFSATDGGGLTQPLLDD
eukprot:m.138050 g.138050  ORF g.138050 m.138050 type:complete len:450 (+) comp14006_c0_seq1:159-1508(+)